MVTFFESLVGGPRSTTGCALGLVLGGALLCTRAWALEYDYDAPAACPDREAFLSEVRSRLRYPAEQSTVERLRVTVRRQQGFEASFVLIEPGQPPVSRALTAEVCDEAVRALALGAALALDARYREVRGIPQDPEEVPAPSAPLAEPADSAAVPAVVPSAPAAHTAPVGSPPVPAVPPRAAATVGVDTHQPGSGQAQAPQAPASTVSARLGAFGATGYSPDPSFGPSLGLLVQGDRFALGLDAFVSSENRAGNGEQSAEFWVVGGRLYPCLRWPLAEFSARGCGVLEFSGVHAEGVEGTGVVRTDEDLVPYWALGLVAGAEAPLTKSLSLSFDLGVQFPLSERRFYFANADEALHEFPVIAARGQLAICYAF